MFLRHSSHVRSLSSVIDVGREVKQISIPVNLYGNVRHNKLWVAKNVLSLFAPRAWNRCEIDLGTCGRCSHEYESNLNIIIKPLPLPMLWTYNQFQKIPGNYFGSERLKDTCTNVTFIPKGRLAARKWWNRILLFCVRQILSKTIYY